MVFLRKNTVFLLLFLFPSINCLVGSSRLLAIGGKDADTSFPSSLSTSASSSLSSSSSSQCESIMVESRWRNDDQNNNDNSNTVSLRSLKTPNNTGDRKTKNIDPNEITGCELICARDRNFFRNWFRHWGCTYSPKCGVVTRKTIKNAKTNDPRSPLSGQRH